MKKIFVDTSAWAAMADSKDTHHHSALLYQDQIIGKVQLISTNYVLDELYTLLLLNTGYQSTVVFKRKLDFLIQEMILKIIWITPQISKETWYVFERFNIDKKWSFTDCSSYVVMKHETITEVFTFDHHFSQMGFIRFPSN